jgi:hypothetical protein
MKTEFRATTPEDAPAVAAFLERIFQSPPGLPYVAPAQLHWKNWEPHPDWQGSHGSVSRGYVMTRDSAIVAHATVVPLTLLDGARRLRIAYPIDWAADPGVVGIGAALLNRLVQMVDALIVAGGTVMAQKVLPAMGAKTCGEIVNFALPLRPLHRLSSGAMNPREIARAGRAALWRLQASVGQPRGWSAMKSPSGPWPHAREGIALFERTNALMTYLLACPASPMEFQVASKEGSVRGYFLLSRTPGQTRIADFYADSEDPEDWRAVVRLAVAAAAEDGTVAEVAAFGSDPITRRALSDAGFRERGTSPIRLLPRKGVELPRMPIRLQMIDGDIAYLHANRPEYWA